MNTTLADLCLTGSLPTFYQVGGMARTLLPPPLFTPSPRISCVSFKIKAYHYPVKICTTHNRLYKQLTTILILQLLQLLLLVVLVFIHSTFQNPGYKVLHTGHQIKTNSFYDPQLKGGNIKESRIHERKKSKFIPQKKGF